MIKNLMLLTLILMTAVMSFIAHELCFEDSTFGGYLPFAVMVVAPMISFFAGRLSLSDLS